jgi:alanine dehydrogenase
MQSEGSNAFLVAAIDHCGCFETTHATAHARASFVADDVIHSCGANKPSALTVDQVLIAKRRTGILT